MPLAGLKAGGSAAWSDVLAANEVKIGADPGVVWTDALDAHGSGTRGPDDSGEYTSNCPNPEHNDGSGDTVGSMRWRQAADGQVLFHCHAGCEGEDVLASLGLTFVQLRWPRTEYHYRSDLRELTAVHVKTPVANGKKRYWWEHPENGSLVNGRGTQWEEALWCLPDLQEHAHEAAMTDTRLRVWLCEGEKDCIEVTAALEQGWVPAGEEDWAHLVTTSADGAASWNRELSAQVCELSPSGVTIVCDSDDTGVQRGAVLIDSLHEHDAELEVNAVSWVGVKDVKDAADAIRTFGRHWLRKAIAAADADVYLFCSFETGWLYEAEVADLRGELTGKRAMHRMVSPGQKGAREECITKWPVRVTASTISPGGEPVGWELDLGGGGVVTIKATDLVGRALEAWNTKIGLFIVPAVALGASFRAYLGFHSQAVGSMVAYDHEGWIDAERFVTSTGMLIGPAGETGRAALAGTNGGEGGIEWHYGLAGEHEAAEHVANLLTFRDLNESGPVVAWLAAVAVRPRALAASGASFAPLLQVPGGSGVGKTSFLKLATRLFGLSGNAISNVTSAGLVRTLALTTGVVWIDDFTNYDDTIRDVIRGGLTGAGRTRGTTASERGIVRDEAHASLINSGEHAFDANERAMMQRSVMVEFTRSVQDRASRKYDGKSQYTELAELGLNRDDHGKGLSRWAGSVFTGLWKAAKELDERQGAAVVQSGVRGAAAWEFVGYGARVLAEWLRTEGIAENRIAKLLEVLDERVRLEVSLAITREKSGSDTYLVQELLPRYLNEAEKNRDAGVSAITANTSAEEVRAAIKAAWSASFGNGAEGTLAERPPRAVVVLRERAANGDDVAWGVAVCAELLYRWATSAEGLRAGVSRDERHVSQSGLGAQLRSVAEAKTAGADEHGNLMVRFGRTAKARYKLITDVASVRLLTGGWDDEEL